MEDAKIVEQYFSKFVKLIKDNNSEKCAYDYIVWCQPDQAKKEAYKLITINKEAIPPVNYMSCETVPDYPVPNGKRKKDNTSSDRDELSCEIHYSIVKKFKASTRNVHKEAEHSQSISDEIENSQTPS